MFTKQDTITLYRFLQCAKGGWRNALYIECGSCPYSSPVCSGYLLTANSDGKPILYPILLLHELTGEEILKDECAGILSLQAFSSLYSMRLLWDADSGSQCGARQMFLRQNGQA